MVFILQEKLVESFRIRLVFPVFLTSVIGGVDCKPVNRQNPPKVSSLAIRRELDSPWPDTAVFQPSAMLAPIIDSGDCSGIVRYFAG
jgi:hypothetical protein